MRAFFVVAQRVDRGTARDGSFVPALAAERAFASARSALFFPP